MNDRIVWMDFLRGLCILLVIIQHWISSIPQSFIDTNYIYSFIFDIKSFFAPYRMELLFFLSGLVVIKSIRKDNEIYKKGKIDNLIYPYIIWSLIYFSLYNLGNLIKGEYEKIGIDFFSIILGGSDITWFLYFLFIYFMLIKKIRNYNYISVIIISLFLYFLSYNYNFYVKLGVTFLRFSDLFYYFIFFYIADQLNINKVDILKLSKNKIISVISIISLLIVYIINSKFNFHKTDFIYLIPVITSFPIFIFISNLISEKIKLLSSFVFHFSKFSIVYYLSHMVIIFIGFIGFKKLNLSENYYFIILLFALLVPFLYIKIANKYKVLWVFFKKI